MWTNLDHPDMSEGWAYPTPTGSAHYFREGRSLCGRYTIPPRARIAGRLDEGSLTEQSCLTCERVATREIQRDWCEHQDPPGECPDCEDEAEGDPDA